MSPDDALQRFSFFFAIGMDFFEEVAKLRAARRLWAHLVKEKSVAGTRYLLRLLQQHQSCISTHAARIPKE